MQAGQALRSGWTGKGWSRTGRGRMIRRMGLVAFVAAIVAAAAVKDAKRAGDVGSGGNPALAGPIGHVKGVEGEAWVSEDAFRFVRAKLTGGYTSGGDPAYTFSKGVKDLRMGGIREEAPYERFSADVDASPDGAYEYRVFRRMDAAGNPVDVPHELVRIADGFRMELPLRLLAGAGLWIDGQHYLRFGGIGEEGMWLVDTEGRVRKLEALSAQVPYLGRPKLGGSKIFFEGERSLSALETSDMDQPSVTLLPDAPGSATFSPSPDGRMLAVAAVYGNDATKPMDCRLQLLDEAGKPIGEPISRGVWISPLVWSPDGTRLAYSVKATVGGPAHLEVLDVASGEKRAFLHYGYSGEPTLAWSASGRKLLVGYTDGDKGMEHAETWILPFK